MSSFERSQLIGLFMLLEKKSAVSKKKYSSRLDIKNGCVDLSHGSGGR